MGNMLGFFNRQKKSSVSRSRRQGIDRNPSSLKNKYALILATFTSLTQPKDKSKITTAQIKLHGSPLSTATQRVLVCLHEKGLEFDFEIVDMKSGAHKQEPFISMNPFGQVPAFVDGDLHLFESRAITKYIAEAYAEKGTPLLAEDIKQKAATQVWAEVEAHQFDPAASKLAWELLYKPLFGLTTDAAAVEENEAKLSKVLDVYERKLSKTKYLAGESFTLADMHHIPTVQCVLKTSAKKLLESRPLVSAWVADITARPAWAKVVAS